MLVINNLSKAYEAATTRHVLNDISLSLSPGSCVAIMGDSGVGKSTLLNIIAGLDTADSGQILLENTVLSDMDEPARTRFRR